VERRLRRDVGVAPTKYVDDFTVIIGTTYLGSVSPYILNEQVFGLNLSEIRDINSRPVFKKPKTYPCKHISYEISRSHSARPEAQQCQTNAARTVKACDPYEIGKPVPPAIDQQVRDAQWREKSDHKAIATVTTYAAGA